MNRHWNNPSSITVDSGAFPAYYPLIIWIFTESEGDGIEFRLPFKIFSTLTPNIYHIRPLILIYFVFSNFSSLKLADESGILQTIFKNSDQNSIGKAAKFSNCSKTNAGYSSEYYLKVMHKGGLISESFGHSPQNNVPNYYAPLTFWPNVKILTIAI